MIGDVARSGAVPDAQPAGAGHEGGWCRRPHHTFDRGIAPMSVKRLLTFLAIAVVGTLIGLLVASTFVYAQQPPTTQPAPIPTPTPSPLPSFPPLDNLSGGSGWVGAGLLGAVLSWLLWVHLPAKDKQIAVLLEKKDAQIDSQRAEFTTTLNGLMAGFKEEAKAERMACEKHFATLADSMNSAFRTLGDQLNAQIEQLHSHSERNRQWLEVLKKHMESQKLLPPAEGGHAG